MSFVIFVPTVVLSLRVCLPINEFEYPSVLVVLIEDGLSDMWDSTGRRKPSVECIRTGVILKIKTPLTNQSITHN